MSEPCRLHLTSGTPPAPWGSSNAQPTPRTRDLASDTFYTTFTAPRNDLRHVLHLPPIAVFALVRCLDLAFNAYTMHFIRKDRTPVTVLFTPSQGRRQRTTFLLLRWQ